MVYFAGGFIMAYFRKVPAKNGKGYTWGFTINLPNDPMTGKRRQLSRRGFETKKEAERKAADLLEKATQGINVQAGNIKIKDYAKKYLKGKLGRIADTTFAQYKGKIDKYIIPFLGEITLEKLNTRHAEDFLDFLNEETDLGNASINKTLEIARTMIKKAVAERIIFFNPFTLIQNLKESVRIKTWTFEESEKLLKYINSHPTTMYSNFICIALNTGMRKGEVLGLRKRDIDFKSKQIHVNQSIYEKKGGAYIGKPKTANSKRTILFDENIEKYLKDQISKQNALKLLYGKSYHDNDLIISYEDGKPMRPTNINKFFNRIIKAAGVPKIRIHDMRHTHATQLLELGVNPKIVSERLGHASVKITLDLYSHVKPDMQVQGLALLSERLNMSKKKMNVVK
jgi:integrase